MVYSLIKKNTHLIFCILLIQVVCFIHMMNDEYYECITIINILLVKMSSGLILIPNNCQFSKKKKMCLLLYKYNVDLSFNNNVRLTNLGGGTVRLRLERLTSWPL